VKVASVFALVVAGCAREKPPPAPPPPIAVHVPPAASSSAVIATIDAGPPAPKGECRHVADSSVSRYGSTGTVLEDGRVLIVGGAIHDAAGPYSAVVETFDPTTKAVEKTTPLSLARAKHAAVRLADGRVLVVSGQADEKKSGFTRTAEVFDPRTKVWKRAADIPEGAQSIGIARLADGRVLIAGGDEMYKARKLSQTLLFEPSAKGFTRVSEPASPRAGPLVPLADGRVLFVGDASNFLGDDIAEVDVFDPALRTWSRVPSPLGMPVYDAVRAGDDAIFVRGEAGVRRFALVDDTLANVRDFPDPKGERWIGALGGDLFVAGESQIARWDAGARKWINVATTTADPCSTFVPLPPRRLLTIGRCDGAQGAVELCEL
jgi:hypothetical protein